MFALLPNLLFLTPVSGLLLRLTLAILYAFLAWNHGMSGGRIYLALPEILLAGLLAAGAWTQAAALASAVILVALLWMPQARPAKSTVWLALAMSLSLVMTGGGFLAFDLPL